MTVDSVITDLRPFVGPNGQNQLVDGIVVGQYQDQDFGKISAQPFLGIFPSSNTALNSTAVFDSVTIQLRLNFYAYGFSGEKQHRITVHEITGDTLSLFGGHRYYANSTPPAYNPDPLGEATVTVHYDSLRKKAIATSNQQDTLFLTGRLTDDFGLRIFDAIKSGFTSASQHKIFKSQFKGVTLVPGTEEGILGMNIINTFGQLSRVNVHYHTKTDAGAVADTLVRTLGFEFASFTKIDVDRTGTELAAVLPYEPFEPLSGQRYVQSGAPVVTRLDLEPFYKFADSIEHVLINSAELVIDGVTGPQGRDPHNALMLQLMNSESNQFLNNRVAADRPVAQGYYVLSNSAEPYYFAATENSGPATISYDADDDRFSGFITLFTQSLVDLKTDEQGINDNRLQYLALVPSSPSMSQGVSRTLFDQGSVSLRIFYTRANTVIP